MSPSLSFAALPRYVPPMVDARAAGPRQSVLVALVILLSTAFVFAAEPPCDPVAPAALSFEFTADPAQPTVGDDVAITVRISNPGGSAATRPQYALLGYSPVLDGDPTPTSTNAATLGNETLTYRLKAMQAGTAPLVLSVNYSTPAGCKQDPITQFTNTNSAPFKLTVVAPTPAAAEPTACPTLAPCAGGFTKRCADESGCVCTCVAVEGSPKCDAAPAPELTFEFSLDPVRPTVGDQVTLKAIVRNTTEGIARRPQYSLQGMAPVFSGDFSPSSLGVGSLGNDTVTYTLDAAQAGTAQVSLAVSLETVGCRGEAPSLTNIASPAYAIEVVSAETTPTEGAAGEAPDTGAPPPQIPAPAAVQATPTAQEAPPTATAAVAKATATPQRTGGGCGGSCSATTADGAWPLLALAALLALRRRVANH